MVTITRIKNRLQWATIGALKILYEFIDLILAAILIGAVYHFFVS